MPATMRDVAEEAGVALSTVSRVLNSRDDAWVSAGTRERILEAAERLGYRSNPFARALSSGRSPVIVFVLGTQSDQAMATKAWTLHETVGGLGREVLTTHFSGHDPVRNLGGLLETIRPAAVAWLHPRPTDSIRELILQLHADRTPVLLIDCPSAPPADLPCDALIVDREVGARIATEHLIERGHRRIGAISWRESTRMSGYLGALADAGITESFEEALDGPTAPTSGEAAARRLLKRHPDLTALFCHTDLMAVGATKAIRDLGYRIPEDMAVAGFDDDPWSPFFPVPLTTLRHPVDQLCEHTEELLRARLEGDERPFRRVELQPKLVVRASTSNSLSSTSG